ncbi:stage III sporulation protein AF [Salipaludibacillus daqingensis]|uniref:stage III sporulation protein AF n=1 Tax=Salipaludibacillus daqingensis TaxID=3041001 RepID=UPI002473418D|nr:stage III sporulation protein AF [Salipaludibacillus daqingensis]
MALISSWITNILLLILFATILELLLPNSSTQRYVKLVVGLMLLVAMLQPILSIFQEDPETLIEQMEVLGEGTYENNTDNIHLEKSDIESESLAYISEQVAVQLRDKAQVSFLHEFEMKIVEVTVNFHSLHEQEDKKNLESIYVSIQKASEEEMKEKEDEIQIDPIVIESETSTKSKDGDLEGKKQMKTHLADLWEVPEETIIISEKGGRNR